MTGWTTFSFKTVNSNELEDKMNELFEDKSCIRYNKNSFTALGYENNSGEYTEQIVDEVLDIGDTFSMIEANDTTVSGYGIVFKVGNDGVKNLEAFDGEYGQEAHDVKRKIIDKYNIESKVKVI